MWIEFFLIYGRPQREMTGPAFAVRKTKLIGARENYLISRVLHFPPCFEYTFPGETSQLLNLKLKF